MGRPHTFGTQAPPRPRHRVCSDDAETGGSGDLLHFGRCAFWGVATQQKYRYGPLGWTANLAVSLEKLCPFRVANCFHGQPLGSRKPLPFGPLGRCQNGMRPLLPTPGYHLAQAGIRGVEPQDLLGPRGSEGISGLLTPRPPPASASSVGASRKGIHLRMNLKFRNYIQNVSFSHRIVLGDPTGLGTPKCGVGGIYISFGFRRGQKRGRRLRRRRRGKSPTARGPLRGIPQARAGGILEDM